MTTALKPAPTPGTASENVRMVVKMLLAASDMTALEMGRRLGLSRTPLYDRMQGRKPFTVDELAKLVELFHAPVGMFFAGPDAMLGRGRSTQETFGREPGRETRKSLHATYPGIGPRLARLAA
jgi:transcriptional regulator with XRE-family HTH domain